MRHPVVVTAAFLLTVALALAQQRAQQDLAREARAAYDKADYATFLAMRTPLGSTLNR